MIDLLDGKTVKFIAVDNKYARQPYPCMAPLSDSMNTYVTGQHIVPGDPKTSQNLTIAEMIGKKQLTTAKGKRFQYVINPENVIQIFHGRAYDCTLDGKGEPINAKDYWQAIFIFLQDWVVAKNKEAVKPGKHRFYLQDKEAEARSRVLRRDIVYEAEKKIREELAVEDYKTIIYVLNMRVHGFYHEPETMNDTQLKDVLLQQADKNPKEIEYFFSDAAKPFLLGARLYGDKIISKRHDGYYYNQQFLAVGNKELARFLMDDNNADIVDKLKQLLRNKKGN